MSVRLGPDGRVLISANLRRAFGAAPGDPLVARVQGRQLVIERREDVLRRLQDRFERVPAEISLADELLADRRRDRDREEG